MATVAEFRKLEQKICSIHTKKSVNRYKPENLTKILGKLEEAFNDKATRGLMLECGKIVFPNKVGEGVIEIKDALNLKNPRYMKSDSTKEAEKEEFRSGFSHVAEYVNDYRFKSVQKKLSSLFRNKTAHQYEPEELRNDLKLLNECFEDAKGHGWDDKFFSDIHSAIYYTIDAITLEEARRGVIDIVPNRLIQGVDDHLTKLERRFG